MQRSASPDITDIGASFNRNVGRPRKTPAAPTAAASIQPISSPQDVPVLPASNIPVPEQSPPPIVKRGRGRPKKSVDLVQPTPVSPATPPTPPSTGKRRGRKPKAAKESVESPNLDVSESVPDEAMDTSDSPHQFTDLNISKGVDSVVAKMETEDVPETSSFFSSILKSEQPFGQQSGIPGLDLNDGDGSSNALFAMDNTISFPFGASSGVEEECKNLQQLSISNKVKTTKSTTVDTEVKTEETSTTNNEENESSKVRRSSRIKTLEERGSRGRRREVVSSLSDCSGISRSNLSLNEDDSNSNSSFNMTGGTTSGYSSPSREYAGSSLANSYSTPNLHALGTSGSSNNSSKPLKVKSRWRYSLDAESLKSFNSSGDSGVSDSCTGSSAIEEYKRPDNCVQRSGHLLFDGTDSELLEKLKRFEGIDESMYKNEGRKKLCKEGKGMSCDCQLTNEDLMRGETGCGEDCLNRLLMVECGNECVLGKRCSNKRFQRKEYAPLEVFKTEKKGHGLRTLNSIPEGGFVIEYVGEVLDVNEFEKRTATYAKGNLEHFYFMALKSDAIIDATQKGNCSRFINHSCEPNCETQKWTVNGEVRIGFFAIKDLRPGDEITFDYQFQRYGKKAQRCFCMAEHCRGWIGEEDDETELTDDKDKDISADVEAEVEDCKVKPKPKPEKKKRKNVQLEDMAFREELAKLEASGLKNRNHTLTLSRLMVRAESWDDRERLLKILINGGTPCRRLFLDYHGLRLVWSWMVDLPLPHENGGPQLIRNDIYHMLFLRALQSLPIPNKTILLESKVLSLIEKWCAVPSVTTSITLVKRNEAPVVQVEVKKPTVETPADGEVIVKTETNEENMDTSEIKEEPTSTVEGMQELVEEQAWGFVAISKSVLDSWADLKEVFRIPKKERVEQMKEHEREADKGQQIAQPSGTAFNNSYERDHRNKQMHRNRGERRVPVLDPTQNQQQFHRFPSRSFPVMPPGYTKEEWRRQFEQTVKQQEEQNQLRKQQDALVILHQERCALVGLDPSITPIVDPHGIHYLDPKTVMWRTINVEDPSMPPELIKFLQLSQHPAPTSDIPLVELPLVIVPEVESETGYPPWPEGLPGPPPLPPRELPKNWKMAIDDEGRCYYYHIRTRVTRWDPPNPYDVSSSESSESSTEEEEEEEKTEEASEGSPSISKSSILTWRTKLIERAERRKKTGLVQERIISPRGEDDKGFSKEMVKENKKKVLEEKLAARLALKAEENLETETLTPAAESKKDIAIEVEKDTKSEVVGKVAIPRKKSSSQGRSSRRKDKHVSSKSAPKPKPKVTSRPDDSARTSGSSSPIETELDLTLSQQNLDEDDETFLSRVPPTAGPSRIITSTPSMDVVIPGLGYDSRDIKHMKDKKVADKADRAARHAAKKKAMHQKKVKEKAAAEAADKDKRVSSKEASCIKDSFRNSIATVVVAHLNPYRKNEHIKNTDDFKHLARKITHAILLKELKHTRDVHSLEVTDSVKHKTKEYIKKFMARFPHGVYIRSPEQTQSK